MPNAASIVISVVSHGQAALVGALLHDIQQHCLIYSTTVIVTLNIDEPLIFSESDFDFRLEIICNARPKGFGANHNAAFQTIAGDYFCVMNPDIRLQNDPFPLLLLSAERESVGVVAPQVVNKDQCTEDSARRLPTPVGIISKALYGSNSFDYEIGKHEFTPDWVAGMFMLFPSDVFEKIGGFDERYFLYYEDVDLCCRLGLAGYKIALNPSAVIVHDARRQSHRNVRYFIWHLTSMLRFFLSPVYRDCLNSKRSQENNKIDS
jgi:GT2 family glycosyltransferase